VFGQIPRRLRRESNRYALVDGIPFRLPVASQRLQALMAAFPVDPGAAQALLPDRDVRAARLWRRALLVVTVVNYEQTVIGTYIEYSIALACVHRERDPLPLLPFLLRGPYQFGQYVYDLPVSTEISVKGGKGIWGMPKHQASLDFKVGDAAVSSQYDLDGQLGAYVELELPRRLHLPLAVGASNYCQFRGMLMKSTVYFKGRAGIAFGRGAKGRFELGDHPRLQPLQALDIAAKPVFTVFFPEAHGVLDDHSESWFLDFERPPVALPEGLESVVGLGLGEEWPPPPSAPH
jgi:Acetoacetate decarboxylase (ADC)